MKQRIGLLLAGIALLVPFSHAGDVEAGKQIAETQCAACHGMDGNSINPAWPKLAGQNAEFIAEQIAKFKSGERDNAMMAPVANALSEQDVANVSAFFAAQTGTVGKADPEIVEVAEKIYRGGIASLAIPACAACHGPSGEGNAGAKYPRLSGQHADYTRARLAQFKAQGQADDVDSSNIMAMIAAKLTDNQVAALASYVQGLSAD